MEKRIPITSLVKMELPQWAAKRYHTYFMASAAYAGVATSMIASKHVSFMAFTYTCAALLIIFGLLKKRAIILKGYKEGTFIIHDYTYLHPYQKKPTGLLLLPPDGSFNGTFLHVAVADKRIPPVGVKIKVMIPVDAKLKKYRDRVYFSYVYGYEIDDEDYQ